MRLFFGWSMTLVMLRILLEMAFFKPGYLLGLVLKPMSEAEEIYFKLVDLFKMPFPNPIFCRFGFATSVRSRRG